MGKRNRMQRERKKIDRTLLELIVGIVFWGLLCQMTGIWFVADKLNYSIGIWLGTAVAAGAGAHMWWGLDRALNYSQDAAQKQLTKYNIIRYLFIVVVLAIIMLSEIANPLSAFLALMGLKVAAYAQPITHRICSSFYREDMPEKK
ncbi:hypothetical protein [Kineothrix sp. MB12-C1]|uniref:hypothetical protein n=1 Tax=Kineothrix sp. MB12-C1 TaxID=3070215 RepID=UPI0027D2FCB2|nr:hypothetical protein [Kineothrix sp. MB12-C1]WMC94122.1 hypothetical protein RBB56_07620 [Kineothrix sp. MB12-C1]